MMPLNQATLILFDQHLNQAGRGIKKWIGNHGKTPPLQDLINGLIPATSFSPTKLKTFI